MIEFTEKVLLYPETLRSKLDGSKQPNIRINQVKEGTECCFLDIKLTGVLHRIRAKIFFAKFHATCLKEQVTNFSRSSIGFYHSNMKVLAITEIPDCTTILLCPSINPKENDAIIKFLNSIS